MRKPKFHIEKWNHEGFAEILCSPGAQSICDQIGQRIKEQADAGLNSDDTPGFETGGKIVKAYGSDRWMQFVHTTDAATMLAEKYDQVLSKAVN